MTLGEENKGHASYREWLVAAAIVSIGMIAIVGISSATGVLEREQGCPPDARYCYGPEGAYYTVFDAPVVDQGTQAAYALGLSLGVFGAATYVDRRTEFQLPFAYRLALATTAFPLLFLLIVYLHPTVYVY